MTHRKAICIRCRKAWNISIDRDTSHGYICPICAWRRREGGMQNDPSENHEVRVREDVHQPHEC